MQDFKKKIRFWIWLIGEFLKKNVFWTAVGFGIFFLGLIFIFVFKPFFARLFFGNVRKVGRLGTFTYNNPPPEVLSLISRPILTIDEKGGIVPILVTQWEMRNGGKSFRFFFRKDLVWNDGKEFSVKDIASDLFTDAKVQIIDDYTLEVSLQQSTVILPYYLRRPIHRYPLIGIGGEYEVTKVKLKEGRFDEIVLTSKLKGDVLIYRFYNSESQLVNAFKVGKVDSIQLREASLVEEIKDWKNVNFTTEIDYTHMAVIFFNLKNKLLQEKNFREAISYLVPWGEVNNVGQISRGPIPPISNFYNESLPAAVEDEEKGIKLIKEVVKDEKVNLKIKSDYRLTGVAEELADRLGKAGVLAEVEVLTGQIEKDFDLLIVFWKVPIEVDQYFFWHSTQTDAGNITGYKNLRIDKYLEDSRSTFSFEKQYVALKKFQEEIVRDKPAVFLYFPYLYNIERKKLIN